MVAVKVSEFKTRIAKYLRLVRSGHEVEILDRDTPIARVTSLASPGATEIHAPAKDPEGLSTLRSKVSGFTGEAIETLLEEREER